MLPEIGSFLGIPSIKVPNSISSSSESYTFFSSFFAYFLVSLLEIFSIFLSNCPLEAFKSCKSCLLLSIYCSLDSYFVIYSRLSRFSSSKNFTFYAFVSISSEFLRFIALPVTDRSPPQSVVLADFYLAFNLVFYSRSLGISLIYNYLNGFKNLSIYNIYG